MKKTKILHIIKSLGRGGAEMLLPETLKLHNKDKFEFHYIYFLPWKNQMVDALEQNGGKVTCLAASNNLQIMLTYGLVKKYITDHGIQLVHCHLPWAGVLGRLIFIRTHIPVIYTEHNKQERYHFLTRFMNRLTFNYQSAAIAVSQDVAASVENGIGTRLRVYEIPNGVNVTFFRRSTEAGAEVRSRYSIPPDAVVVGTVAVFRFQKRLREWLEIFASVNSVHPNIYGIVVGDGPLREEIIKRCRELKLQEKVIFAGLQTDVVPWYSAMDIFMMASQFEGLPVALLEAMSMECAIITTNAGGIKQVVVAGKSGIMVPVEDWQEMSALLSGLVSDPQKRRTLSAGARDRVMASFGMDKMVNELEALYFQLLSNHEVLTPP